MASFPNYKNKHREESLFHPEDFVRYKNWSPKDFPKKVIIVYQRSSLRHFLRKYRGKYKKLNFTNGHVLFKYGNVGFIRMNGIGSPNAATLLEELMALGAMEFLSMGTAGGLQEEGIFIVDRAIRDEGTSHHYEPAAKYAYPDKELSERLGKIFEKRKIEYKKGTSWTIDAPYRETKAEIEKYRKEGVATVEMEASALFTVARKKGAKISSALVVSDILGKKWEPKFHHLDMRRSLNNIIDAGIECLK